METFRIAIEALRRHKMRSFLTLLGVIIGVMTIVGVVSVISGLNDYVSNEVFQLNPDVFVVTRFGIITSREQFLEALKRKEIDMRDARDVEARCQNCGMVGTGSRTQASARYRSERLSDVLITGSTANMAELQNLDIEAGRYFTPGEEQGSSGVVVIGWDLKEHLFGRLDPIGRSVQIEGRPLKVIGVLRKQGSVLGQNMDKQAYMPLSTYLKTFGSRQGLALFVRPSRGLENFQEAQDDVRVIMRARRHTPFNDPDPFSMVTAEALQNLWKGISGGAFALLAFISGISLGVGGIVIMNIMLVSVIERTREIGIRRAMGARRADIQRQFLTEAVLLSAGGGAIGVGLGMIIAKVVATMTPMPTLVRPSLMITGLAVAIITGVLAGLFPALKAAKLPPVEALRYE